MHSTQEFLLPNDWVEKIYSVPKPDLAGSGCARRDKGISETRIIQSLLGVGEDFDVASLSRFIAMRVPKVAAPLVSHVRSLNEIIGVRCNARHGFRTAPLLVVTKDFPWASFFVPTFDAQGAFSDGISSLCTYGFEKNNDCWRLLVGAIYCLLVTHPFLDCNGRTARLLAYSIMANELGWPLERASLVASSLSGRNSSFVLAMWQTREEGIYGPLLSIFK